MSVLANLISIGTCQHFVSAIHLYFAKIVRFKSLSVHKFRNPLMINSLLDQQSAKRTNHHQRSSVRLQFFLKVKLNCVGSNLLVGDWLKISIRESSLEFLNSNSIWRDRMLEKTACTLYSWNNKIAHRVEDKILYNGKWKVFKAGHPDFEVFSTYTVHTF